MTAPPTIAYRYLGLVPYRVALQLQETLVRHRLDIRQATRGKADHHTPLVHDVLNDALHDQTIVMRRRNAHDLLHLEQIM
jgi:hypothetical protein